MKRSKILITGATGYIGTHVVNLLNEKKYDIHAITRKEISLKDNNKVKWHRIDLLSSNDINSFLIEYKPKFLIHLAWKVGSGLQHDLDENVIWLEKSKELIKLFYENGGKRVLVSGTCAEYDWSYEFMKEYQTPLNASNRYGEIKFELYSFLKTYCDSNGYSWVWPRLFFSYGPGQNEKSLVPSVVNKLMDGIAVDTTEGQQQFDYLYVEDLAEGLIKIFESPFVGPLNLCSGKTIQLKKIILFLAKFFNKEKLINFGSIKYSKDSPMQILGDNTILKNEIDWIPNNSMEEGLIKTIEYLKNGNE